MYSIVLNQQSTYKKMGKNEEKNVNTYLESEKLFSIAISIFEMHISERVSKS